MPEYSTPKVTPTETTKIPGMNGNSSGYIDAKDLLDIIRATFGQANGVATLGPDGRLTSSQLPTLADDVIVATSYATLDQPGMPDKLYITADNNKMYRWDDALATPDYVELSVDLSDYATKAELAAEESAREAEDTNLKNAIDAIEDGTTVVEKAKCDKNGDEIDTTYAKQTGYYKNLGAGTAEQLISSIYETDSVPYNFRTSGGSLEIGDREEDEVVGGTIVWNQLMPALASGNGYYSGNTYSSALSFSDGVCTVTVYNNGFDINYNLSLANGRTYLVFATLESSVSTTIVFRRYTNTANVFAQAINANQKTNIAFLFTPNSDSSAIQIIGLASASETLKVSEWGLHDLTAMFGSTIADYIYNLEQGTAGAGVAWFRKLFPKPYYSYDAGTMMSVKTSSHDMTGFNQWDEEWELGSIDASTGQLIDSTTTIRSKNKIAVIPNTTYYFRIPNNSTTVVSLHAYDANDNWLGNYNWRDSVWQMEGGLYNVDPATFTTPSNCAYIRFRCGTGYGTTYNHDICLSIHWDGERDGEYEPYVKNSYPLDDIELRGIPKLDGNGKLYYDGDVYKSDGSVTRKYGIVDLGTLNWSYDNYGSRVIATISDILDAGSRQLQLVCSNYTSLFNNEAFDSSWNKVIYSVDLQVYLHDSNITSSDIVNGKIAKLNNVYLVYPLATPDPDTATPYTNPQIVNDFGTEEYVDTREVAIPVGHNTKYQPNLRAKLEMAPDSPSGDGEYVVKQTSGKNEYVLLSNATAITNLNTRVPACSTSTDGTFVLKATVSSGSVTYAWVQES